MQWDFYRKLLTAIKIKRLGKLADKVLALEEDTAILTDEEIREKQNLFKRVSRN